MQHLNQGEMHTYLNKLCDRILLVPLFFISFHITYSQAFDTTDSLKNVVKNARLGDSTLAFTLNHLGKAYFANSDYPLALETFMQAVFLAESLKDTIELRKGLKYCGSLHRRRGNNIEALDYYYKALPLYNGYKDQRSLSNLFNAMAIAYNENADYKKSIHFFKEALAIHRSIGNLKGEADILNNIGIFYSDTQEFDSALMYFNASIDIRQGLGLEESEFNYANIGRVYQRKSSYQKALTYFFKALEISEKGALVDDQMEVQLYIGEVYFQISDFPNAIQYLIPGLQLAKRLGSKYHAEKGAGYLAKAHASQGQYKLAYYYDSLKIMYMDSLHNENNDNRVVEIEKKYELDKKQSEIEYILQKGELEAKRRGLFNLLLASGGVFALILLLILWRYHKRKQKFTKLLYVKNEEINKERINQLIKERDIKLIQSQTEGEERERARLAVELHDGLGGLLSSIKLRLSVLAENKNDEIHPIVNHIDLACKELRAMSYNLSPPPFNENIFSELIKNLCEQFRQVHGIALSLELYPESRINALHKDQKINIYRIIQELLNNVAKHAGADSVEIQLLAHENYLNMLFEDNGSGFDSSKQKRGIGIDSMFARVKMLGGLMEIDSKPNRGTLVNINIKIENEGRKGDNPKESASLKPSLRCQTKK